MPGFPKVVEAIARAYRENRGDVVRTTAQLIQRMEQVTLPVRSLEPLTAEVLGQAYRAVAAQFDDRHGGVGLQPKFPQPMTYEFLLRYYQRVQDPDALEMVELTLDRMANGGIYDQIGGGFHRYSTDTYWLVPHFEKMLYDNALLVKLYLRAYQVTGKDLYRRVVEETLDYVRREMTDPAGGFYSAQDADSEGVEGKFFVWRPEEIVDVLGEEDGRLINRYYGVTLEGNFEGRSILHVRDDGDEDLRELVERSKPRLLEARSERVAPGLDDKILTSWNGMMLRGFAEAAAVLGRADYAQVANQNAKFILTHLRRDGRLLRTYRDGEAKLHAYLEDYAFLIDGLIALHEVTLDEGWLLEAVSLGEAMIDLFWDDASGQLYDTGRDHEDLIVRPRDVSDNAAPSGSSMATDVLLRLAILTGKDEYRRRAATALRSVRELVARFPTGAGHWLCALDFYLSTVKEIVVVGDPADRATAALLAEVHRSYLPNRLLVGSGAEAMGRSDESESAIPLLEGKNRIGGLPTAYVCRNYVCNLPVTEPAALAAQLAEQ